VSQYDFAHIAMPDEHPRLFLSYGVRDASEIAERLHRDLAARGYQVWQDVRRLRAGRPWDEDVPEGLRTSQVVLALLSPHSVRRALDAENPTATDSVCLDEIAYARDARKIPIVPVQVVSCEAPFLVYRLHQIDFRRWRESEVTYQAGLNQICAGIEAALRGETPERPWRPLLEPWDFAPFLLEKRNHFTGRKWLFRDLNEWRRNEAPPALLITGEPGIGKSAIVAALVHENPEGQVLAYHCCRADTPATLDPARFVRSLAGMLAARLEGYSTMLEDPGIQGALERADSDPASAFEAAILSPLHSVPKTAGHRRYLLVDALDEALTHPKRPTIVEVLAARINRLPAWLGIVATTRSEPGVLSQLRGLPAQALKADDPKNLEDVLAFLQHRLSEPGLLKKVQASGKKLQDVALGVLRSSTGNFLFATTVIDAIEGGQLRFDDIENQPPGRLSSLYEVFFNRLFRDAGIEFQPACQVLEVVAAAREPLSRNQIAAVSGLDAEKELPSLLGRLAAFAPIREGRYSLFHRSLFEWLTGWDTEQDQPFAGPYHLSLQDGLKRLADWCWAEYTRGVQNASLYCLRHLVAHLHEAGRSHQTRTVLLDFDWLQIKLQATDVTALLEDCTYSPQDVHIHAVRSAIQLSAHVIAHDKMQFAGQLLGRLQSAQSKVSGHLLNRVRRWSGAPWLRPLTQSLIGPGRSLRYVLRGQTDHIDLIAVTPDGRTAVSVEEVRSTAYRLTLWDIGGCTGPCVLQTYSSSHERRAHIAITPDGKYLVFACDRSIWVWDLESRTERYVLPQNDWVTDLKIVGSKYAVAILGEAMIKVLSLTKGVELRSFLNRRYSWLSDLAVTPDGGWILFTTSDHTVLLWEWTSARAPLIIGKGESSFAAVALSPDGSKAILAGVDFTLYIWDLNTRTNSRVVSLPKLQSRFGNRGRIRRLVLSSPKRVFGWFEGSDFVVWDVENGNELYKSHDYECTPTRTAFTPDASVVIFSTMEDRLLRVANLAELSAPRVFGSYTGIVRALAVTPDGGTAVSVSDDSMLRIWDLRFRSIEDSWDGSEEMINMVAATSKGRKAVSVRGGHLHAATAEVATVWDLDTGRELYQLAAHSRGISAMALTADGERAVTAFGDGSLKVWDLRTGTELYTFAGHKEVISAIALSVDGHMAISAAEDGSLKVWDLQRGRELANPNAHTEKTRSLAISSSGTRAISVSQDCTIRVWDLEKYAILRVIRLGESIPSYAAVTQDCRWAVVMGFDQTLNVWNLEVDEAPRILDTKAYWATCPVVTIDGSKAISVSEGDVLRVWDLKSGVEVFELKGHTHEITKVTVMYDGRRAVSASEDSTLRVWDLMIGKQIACFTADAPLSSCAVTEDGSTIVAGDKSGHLHFLKLQEADVISPGSSGADSVEVVAP
jgi:WD40 repeat protein